MEAMYCCSAMPCVPDCWGPILHHYLQTNPVGTLISLSGFTYPGTSIRLVGWAKDVKRFSLSLSTMYSTKVDSLTCLMCAVQASKLYDNANQTAAEAVSSIRTVAAFSLQVQVSQLYEQQLVGPTKMIERSSQTSGLGFGASQFIIYAVYAVGFW